MATTLKNSTKNTIYKFRAECQTDVDAFLKKAKAKVKICSSKRDRMFPDVVVTIKSDLSKSKVRAIMDRVTDGHVMAQTVERIEDYTGERF